MRSERAPARSPTSRPTTRAWVPVALLFAAMHGCGGTPTESKPTAAPQAAPSSETVIALDGVLRAYETVRAALVDDAIATALEGAGAIETAATGAAGAAGAPIAGMLRDVASTAGALKATSASDNDAVRKAFGEVSRGVVALTSTVPSLQKGRYLFECPMAQGYQRWVQPSDAIANPYMGKSMPKCGAPRSW